VKESKIAIVGCGDVGTRIAKHLLTQDVSAEQIIPIVRSHESKASLSNQFNQTKNCDFDSYDFDRNWLRKIEDIYYLVPPQKQGNQDLRSKKFIQALQENGNNIKNVVLISTTGVYGNCQSEWVTEETALNPTTSRSQRRADMEQQWQSYAVQNDLILSILRVPGIYSFSRLPRTRLESGRPVVDPNECGFTNRIHADDLAMICVKVIQNHQSNDIYNVSDGSPGKMSEYFLEVARFLQIPSPLMISFEQAEKVMTTDMMSYLKESRKISNQKLLDTFKIELKYPDFRQGIQY